jgi:hypothetical protein
MSNDGHRCLGPKHMNVTMSTGLTDSSTQCKNTSLSPLSTYFRNGINFYLNSYITSINNPPIRGLKIWKLVKSEAQDHVQENFNAWEACILYLLWLTFNSPMVFVSSPFSLMWHSTSCKNAHRYKNTFLRCSGSCITI